MVKTLKICFRTGWPVRIWAGVVPLLHHRPPLWAPFHCAFIGRRHYSLSSDCHPRGCAFYNEKTCFLSESDRFSVLRRNIPPYIPFSQKYTNLSHRTPYHIATSFCKIYNEDNTLTFKYERKKEACFFLCGMANSVDPYQQSDLGLHCLLRYVCPKT